jgi:two-component system invasion response regulator UvrY
MIRILIADDHAIVRRGLQNILLEEFPSAEIVDVKDSESLVQKVISEKWNVVITDLFMPGTSGLEALMQIKLNSPELPVLVLSIFPEEQYAIRVFKAGAAGYLNKDLAPEELLSAVKCVLAGKKHITPSLAEKLASAIHFNSSKLSHEYLSDREFEVLKFLAVGKSVSEIGALLHLSVTTVSTYRARLLVKMNMKTNADLTQYAIEYKLI